MLSRGLVLNESLNSSRNLVDKKARQEKIFLKLIEKRSPLYLRSIYLPCI